MAKILLICIFYLSWFRSGISQRITNPVEPERVIKETILDRSEKPSKIIKSTKKEGNTLILAEGYAEIIIETTISENQAKNKAAELARINAIENKFGRVLFQGNSVYLENINTGQKAESSTRFNSISESYVKGEWVEDIKSEYQIKSQNGIRFCRCSISGFVRPLKDQPIQFNAEPLNCDLGLSCATTQFKNNGDLFLYFLSPVDGFLSVYLTDQDYAMCLLPYKNQEDKLFRINRNTEYILFSTKTVDESEKSFTEKYELMTKELKEDNILYLIFSEEEYNNPVVVEPNFRDKTSKLTNKELQLGYDLPKQLQSEDFLKWLGRLRIFNPEVAVQTIHISISK